MTSLDRLREAMSPGESDRSPALPPETVKDSLGQYGLSAAEQLLNTRSEVKDAIENDLDGTANSEIQAQLKKDLTAYEKIFAGAGIKAPTPEELSAAGIDWAHLADLKKDHPDYELVAAPLTMELYDLRKMVAEVTNDKTIPNNPLKRCKWTKANSDGLYIAKENINNWDKIMATTIRECKLPVATLDKGESWVTCLMSSQERPEHLCTSYEQLKQQGLSIPTIPICIVNQARRISQGLPPIDDIAWTWAIGEFVAKTATSRGIQAYAPIVRWSPDGGRIDIVWGDIDHSSDYLGARSPIG